MEILAKVDFAFKYIMKNPKVLKGFLSAVLNTPYNEIKSADIVDSFLGKEYTKDKLGILDVRVLLNNEVQIDIEIQLAYFQSWSNRSLFYLSKMYCSQLMEAEDYKRLKKCVSISILDFVLYKDYDGFYSLFQIYEQKRHTLYTDHMQFHILELPKLPETIEEAAANDLYYWSKFIGSESEVEIKMLAEKNPYIEEAVQELKNINADNQLRDEYFRRKMAIMDYNTQMSDAIAIGEARGIEIGEARGIEIGKTEGEIKKAIEVAKKMLNNGLAIDDISNFTGLDINQIKELQVNN